MSENKEDNFGNHERMIMLVSHLFIGVGNEELEGKDDDNKL